MAGDAVADFHNTRTFHCIAPGIEGDLSGYSLEAAKACKAAADGFMIRGFGQADGGNQDIDGIIGEGGRRLDFAILAVFF